MNAREKVSKALLPALREAFPAISESDLNFFGERADITSAAPKKYGVDIAPEIVYNIKTTPKLLGASLLSKVWESEGFLNFELSASALAALAREAAARRPSPLPEAFGLGDAESVRARLLDIANVSAGEDVLPPAGSAGRIALRICLMADTDDRRKLAAGYALEALAKHRRANASGDNSHMLGRTCALAMAAALEKR